MSERTASVRFVLGGDEQAARADAADFFDARGWVPRVRNDGSIAYEHGSRGLTILLGALAGKRFFLTGIVETQQQEHTTEVVYRWGRGAGQVLGGTVGGRRAERMHTATVEALERHLEGTGRLLSSRRH